jgi:hypothetical protein
MLCEGRCGKGGRVCQLSWLQRQAVSLRNLAGWTVLPEKNIRNSCYPSAGGGIQREDAALWGRCSGLHWRASLPIAAWASIDYALLEKPTIQVPWGLTLQSKDERPELPRMKPAPKERAFRQTVW